jgi:hypothetical protein
MIWPLPSSARLLRKSVRKPGVLPLPPIASTSSSLPVPRPVMLPSRISPSWPSIEFTCSTKSSAARTA